MQFFLYEIVARIVAIYVCYSCGRQLWDGLGARKISYWNDDFIGSLLIGWSKLVTYRDTQPIRYWIEISARILAVIGGVFLLIFGWAPST
jgi:hypothetical protein